MAKRELSPRPDFPPLIGILDYGPVGMMVLGIGILILNENFFSMWQLFCFGLSVTATGFGCLFLPKSKDKN